MPHSQTRIYRETREGVTYGVSISDVNTVLGVASNDLGTLCKASVVNMWAKYKPVTYQGLKTMTGKMSESPYWKGTDGHCGIAITVYDSLGTLSSGFIKNLYELSQSTLWSRAEVTDYRLADFDGYDHAAINPIGAISTTALYIDGQNRVTLAFDKEIVSDDNLEIGDISVEDVPLTDFYFSVLLVKGTQYITVSSEDKFGESQDLQIVLTGASSLVGQWQAIPFFSKVKLTQGGSAVSSKYLSAGFTMLYNINIISSVFTVSTEAMWNDTYTGVAFDVYLDNSGAATTINNMVVSIVRTTGSQQPDAGEVIGQQSFASFSVQGEVVKSGSISGISKTSGYNYWIRVSATNFDTVSSQIEDPEIE